MADAPPQGGLFGSVRGLAATALALLRTRLELLATELAEERSRLLGVLVYAAAALFLIGAGVVLLAIWVTVLFWDSNRILVLGAITALFLLGGVASLTLMVRQLRAGSRLFSASLAELRQDCEALRGGAESKQ